MVGLSSYNFNLDQMWSLTLAEEGIAWRHQVEVVVTEAPEDLTLIQLDTIPLFPQDQEAEGG